MGSDCLLRCQTGQPGALCGPVYLSTVLPINPCLPVWCAKRATEYVSVSFNYPPTTANQLNISPPGCTVLKRSSVYIWECHSDCRLLSDAPFIIPFTSVGFACPLPSWVSHTTSRKYHSSGLDCQWWLCMYWLLNHVSCYLFCPDKCHSVRG